MGDSYGPSHSAPSHRQLSEARTLGNLHELHAEPLLRQHPRRVLAVSREVKAETGGYIQYDAQAVTGKVLDQMHKALGEAIRHKDAAVGIGIGSFTIPNLRDLARGKRGRKAKAA